MQAASRRQRRCRCPHRATYTTAVSGGESNFNGVPSPSAEAASSPLRRRPPTEFQAVGGLARVTAWGVPPRHSIADYMHDSRDHDFPLRWLGASLPALARVRKRPLQPPPLPTTGLLAALAELQAERKAAEGAVVGARSALEAAWTSADSLHAQGVDQADGGLINAWWNKIKATSANQWHVADAGDDLLEAKEALAELDGKIWRQLHVTQLPPPQHEQVINAGVWECLASADTPLALTAELFGAGPPPSLGSAERLSEFFDIEFLRRTELKISWEELTDYTAECEAEADHLAKGLTVDSKPAKHLEALTRSVRLSALSRLPAATWTVDSSDVYICFVSALQLLYATRTHAYHASVEIHF
eukprot:COSAG06_NODE_257_length_18972_cov_14.659196_13_plen_359_part_00